MMIDKNKRVCPIKRAGGLDNRVRRLLQNSQKILGNYVKEGIMKAKEIGLEPVEKPRIFLSRAVILEKG